MTHNSISVMQTHMTAVKVQLEALSPVFVTIGKVIHDTVE